MEETFYTNNSSRPNNVTIKHCAYIIIIIYFINLVRLTQSMWILFLFLGLLLAYALVFAPITALFNKVVAEAEAQQDLLNNEYLAEQMRRRRFAPLHVLPHVKFQASFETLTGVYGGHCFTRPTRVTDLDSGYYNCAAVCGGELSAAYFFVGEHDRVVVDGVQLEVGGYCTTNSVPRNCNRETSILLHSANHWTCLPDDPRYFAGEANMVQVAGRQHADLVAPDEVDQIVLYDNQLQRPVDVTVNTFRRTWDDLMADGRRRFEVRCDALDFRHNPMFLNPLNPIECLPNVCSKVTWVNREVRPDFERGVCECGDSGLVHMDETDPSSECASIVNRLNAQDNIYDFRVECISMDTPLTLWSRDKLLCPPDMFNQNTDFAYTFSLRGVMAMSPNGLRETTWRLWQDTRSRVQWHNVYSSLPSRSRRSAPQLESRALAPALDRTILRRVSSNS
uniref:Per os infectivity factor-2 n=1 Tax=Achaea janata granulovirus TaxID=262174 RepID=L0BWA0_9BBAC|nr:per os infectivity factor-2 [Achaea janata granulovirus]